MDIVRAPGSLRGKKAPFVFLAGSIEMGAAENWQQRVEGLLASIPKGTVLNPRREDWDSSWKQSIRDSRFLTQVKWELEGLNRADWVLMNFCADTQSPITLLELGLTVRTGKLIVSCPDGYWRKGNVDIVCARFGVPVFRCLDDAVDELLRREDA